MELDETYWSNRYIKKQVGWDVGYISTPLKEYIDQLKDKTIRILIPGCGNAHEARYLLNAGFNNITLVDISGILIEQLREEFYPEFEKELHLLHGDFFELKGSFDLIIEQTFFCALDPKFRSDYALKMAELLGNNAKLVGLMFNREFSHEGPPFGGSKEEYEAYFSEYFKMKYFSECYNSIEPRRGSELFICLVRK